jgi:hypothetical protein
VVAAVPGQERDPPPAQGTDDQRVGGVAERGGDRDFRGVIEQGVKAGSAQDPDLGVRHDLRLGGTCGSAAAVHSRAAGTGQDPDEAAPLAVVPAEPPAVPDPDGVAAPDPLPVPADPLPVPPESEAAVLVGVAPPVAEEAEESFADTEPERESVR